MIGKNRSEDGKLYALFLKNNEAIGTIDAKQKIKHSKKLTL